MDQQRRIKVSKYLSRHLRHTPERLGLTLAPGGWVPVDELLAACARNRFAISRDELNEVVATSDKQRFALDDSGQRIRANQGHSADVDLQLEAAAPPQLLYHGTAEAFVGSILAEGLKKMARHHVHLSATIETARSVAARRGRAAILEVAAARMAAASFDIYCSTNGVWLVDRVPPEYLRVL